MAVRKHKVEASETVTHPARPTEGKIDMKAAHAKVAKRFPKILAKLAS